MLLSDVIHKILIYETESAWVKISLCHFCSRYSVFGLIQKKKQKLIAKQKLFINMRIADKFTFIVR